LSAGLADAGELARRRRLIRRKHDAERGDHHIERGVGKWQVFGVRLLKQNCVTLRLCASPPRLEQRYYVVGGGDLAPATRGGQRGIAVAGGDIEHTLPGAQIERLA